MLTYQAYGLNVKTQTTVDMEKELMIDPHEGTHFTCFTGTKLQVLTDTPKSNEAHSEAKLCLKDRGTPTKQLQQFTCFTGTKVQILTRYEQHRGQDVHDGP